jgi:hypothetical protein
MRIARCGQRAWRTVARLARFALALLASASAGKRSRSILACSRANTFSTIGKSPTACRKPRPKPLRARPTGIFGSAPRKGWPDSTAFALSFMTASKSRNPEQAHLGAARRSFRTALDRDARRRIAVFDGAFRAISGDAGFAHAYVRAIAEDSNGRLWVGTETGLFQHRPRRTSAPWRGSRPRRGRRVRALQEDAQGALWVSADAQLYPLRRESFRGHADISGRYDDKVTAMLRGADGGTVVRHTQGRGVATQRRSQSRSIAPGRFGSGIRALRSTATRICGSARAGPGSCDGATENSRVAIQFVRRRRSARVLRGRRGEPVDRQHRRRSAAFAQRAVCAVRRARGSAAAI